MNIKKFIKKITGFEKFEEEAAAKAAEYLRLAREAEEAAKEADLIRKTAEESAKEAVAKEEMAKMSPKERATRKKEPWVGVLSTHVNKDNIRNGFFELDWNEYFILQLKQEGYGAEGDSEEEIVDRWFRELCANVVVDGDYGGSVNTGIIDIQSVKKTI